MNFKVCKKKKKLKHIVKESFLIFDKSLFQSITLE